MDSIDWSGLVWQGVDAVWAMRSEAFAISLWPWLGLFALALLGLLIAGA